MNKMRISAKRQEILKSTKQNRKAEEYVTKLKIPLEGFNSRPYQGKKRLAKSKTGKRAVRFIQSGEKRNKEWKRVKTA